mmetsp:Transcript_11453/g.20585  ORF Transcript_11453/g.20585 Transcript_11453/m.20585 type:complete len:236 (+) Transcript_11453:132-839(+)
MNKFNSAAAFTARAPSRPLPSNALIRVREKKNHFLVGYGLPHSSSLAMGTDSYDATATVAPMPFDSLTISNNLDLPELDPVLSTEDIVIGTVLAFVLAFGWSFLNGQSSSTSFVSWPSQTSNRKDEFGTDNPVQVQDSDFEDSKVFDEDNWKEMSREENYVLYNTKIRQKINPERRRDDIGNKKESKENKLVLVALLVLFVPIFSVEFFFALSRQFMCEMGPESGELVQKLCSPV